jgi:acyl carrier protein
MLKSEFLLLLDNVIEAQPGTLTGTELLQDVEGWDSLAVLGFIALVDEHFGMPLSAESIISCKAVNDLLSLLDTNITE